MSSADGTELMVFLNSLLNVIQVCALAYIAARWSRRNGGT